jgi:hypothetical protein
MPDPFRQTRINARRQADDDLRREDPPLWWTVASLATVRHPSTDLARCGPGVYLGGRDGRAGGIGAMDGLATLSLYDIWTW